MLVEGSRSGSIMLVVAIFYTPTDQLIRYMKPVETGSVGLGGFRAGNE